MYNIKNMPIITFITDFGLKDPYIAMMKGRILSIHSGINCVDITHDIECGDIQTASLILKESYQYFPKGSVHLVVVDPTVGSKRRAIFSYHCGHFFVGPDNGVLSPTLSEVFKIRKKTGTVSNTFEGRDVLAPVAAHLAIGEDPESLGVRIDDPVRIGLPIPEVEEDRIIGEIIHIDNFGNLISNIEGDLIPKGDIEIEIKGNKINGLSRSYKEGKDGRLIGLINAGFGMLEVSLYKGSAASFLNCNKGGRIVIRRKDE